MIGRTPFLRLLRYPALLGAVFAAALILGAITAAGAPFLSATSSGTLGRLIEDDAAFRIPAFTVAADTSISGGIVEYRTSLLARELGPILGEPIVTARGDTVSIVGERNERIVRIVTRTGALDHVGIVDGSGTGGIWLADVTAREMGLEPGDRVDLEGSFGRVVPVEVAGIYRDLLTEPRTPYWAPLAPFIYPTAGADTRPPAFILMDLQTYLSVDDRLLDEQDALTWEFRLPTGLMSITDADRLLAGLARVRAAMANGGSELGAAFRRANLNEPLSGWLSSTREVSADVSTPVNALVLAGQGLALAVVAGSGLFMMRRRRVELDLLHARGVGPLRLAARTAGEVVLPVAAGALAGSGLAIVAIERFGPDGVVSEGAVEDAWLRVGWTAAAAVALVAVVAARIGAERSTGGGLSARGVAARAPWDLMLLVLAGIAFFGVRDVSNAGEVGALDPLFLLFPVLLLAGAAGVAARAVRLALPRLRAFRFGERPASFLAFRRVAAAPRIAASLIAASAVAIGVLVYAGTLTSSLGESAQQGAALTVGGDVSVDYSGTLGYPGALTSVVRIDRASFGSGPDVDLDVLLIDPTTFEDDAFWRSGFADEPLETLMQRMSAPAEEGMAAIVAGDVRVPSEPVLSVPGISVPLRVVAMAETFPGIVGERPVVVMSRDAFETTVEDRGVSVSQLADAFEAWGLGISEDEARRTVSDGGATVLSSVTAAELRDTPRSFAVSWALRFLGAIGVVASSVVLVGGFLYLQTRQRQAETSYALARRMGLSRSAHRWSVAVEVAGLLSIAFVIGATTAAVASAVVNTDVQRRAVEAAVPLFRLPVALLAITASAILVVSWCGAALVQLRADRADVAEVMRVAE
jgi:putative ABC transport system permease protein